MGIVYLIRRKNGSGLINSAIPELEHSRRNGRGKRDFAGGCLGVNIPLEDEPIQTGYDGWWGDNSPVQGHAITLKPHGCWYGAGHSLYPRPEGQQNEHRVFDASSPV